MAAIAGRSGGAASPADSSPFLLRLYPPQWRARYGAEFAELLSARPPTVRDRLDIVRGAIDARLRPQVGDARPPRVATVGDRVLALAAVTVGGLFSTWAGIIVIASPRWGEASTVGNDLLAASFGAGFLGAIIAIAVMVGIAYRHIDDLGTTGLVGALMTAAGFLAMTGEADGLGVPLVALGTLGMSVGLARAVGWAVSAFVVGATLFMVAAMLGFVASTGQDLFWLWMLVGYGPSWMLLGVGLRRGTHWRPPAALVVA